MQRFASQFLPLITCERTSYQVAFNWHRTQP